MTEPARSLVDDLRGAGRLAIEATTSVTELVEAMHHTIAAGPALLGRPLEHPVGVLTRLLYGSIRAVTRIVGGGVDLALGRLALLLGESAPGPEREAVLAALNGVLGDYLDATGNPLAIRMRLRRDGRPLELTREALHVEFPTAGERILLLIHGSCMNDRQWDRRGHDHGALLARALGYTPVHLHYNSGLHVSTNGRALAALLEQLVAAWPTAVDELAIVAHSMGGLVARSACHYGEASGHAWRSRLRTLVCIATPHHGAPLEQGGNWVETLLGLSRYSAPIARLGRLRSAGVTDLRFGNVLDEHWMGRDRFARVADPRRGLPLPVGVACYAIAATTAPPGTDGPLPGDGLVGVESALGRHERPDLTLGFPAAHQWVGHAMGHLELLGRSEVYETIRRWLSEA